MKPDIRIKSLDYNEDPHAELVETANGWTAKAAGYGWVAEPDHSECAFAVQYASRQDGRTDGIVVLTQVDGKTEARQFLVPTSEAHKAIAKAMRELTRAARWLVPLQVVADSEEPAPPRKWLVMDRLGQFLVSGRAREGAQREWSRSATGAMTFGSEHEAATYVVAEFKAYEIVIEGIQVTGEQTHA
jgi:hypothetical protein